MSRKWVEKWFPFIIIMRTLSKVCYWLKVLFSKLRVLLWYMFILDFIYALHMPVLRMRLGGPLAAPFLSFISALFLFPLICYFVSDRSHTMSSRSSGWCTPSGVWLSGYYVFMLGVYIKLGFIFFYF